MNEQDGHLVGIVRMNHVDACCEHADYRARKDPAALLPLRANRVLPRSRVVGRDGIRGR
jgi:hypothetical protein